MLSADILLKGLGGLAVVGGATTVGVFYLKQNKTEKLSDLADRVGLVCSETPTETNGVVCSKKTDANVKVKRDTDSFDATSITGGKIKAYEDKTYNKGFKFVIEEADVTANDNNKKLEEFETYEIKEDESSNKELRLTRKTDVNAGIKKALGLPENCDLPTTSTASDCDISGDKFKKINFDGKGETDEAVSGTPKLKISKLETTDNDYGKYKFKFVLESDQDSKISKTVTIKKGTNTEFKIKATSTSGTPKVLTLEKAWTVKSLGDKVGLTCPENGDTVETKECTLQTSKVNLKVDDKKKFSGLSKKDTNEKKVKYDVGEADYSQGYRFYTEETNGIELQNGSADGGTDSDKKIEPKGSAGSEVYYEILKDTDGKWYLTKKAKAQGS